MTVLTGLPNHPTGVVPPEYRGRWLMEERTDGYRVVRCWLYATPNEGMLRKTLGHLSFMVSSVVLGGLRSGPADVVVVSSPTFFSIFSAWLLARLRGAKLVVEVRDLWPGIFVELGVLTNRSLIRSLEKLELVTYHAADLVIVVSRGFRDNLLERRVPAEKVHTIYNGADLHFESRSPQVGKVRAELGAADGAVLVLYIGAHGISHGLGAVADAAQLLQGEHVRFAFVGEGAAKAQLVRRVEELGIDNVSLLPGVPRDEVAGILAAADICLVPLRDIPLFSTFIPSKMFEYLAAAKAVIGSVRGEPAMILREAGAVVVDPEEPEALAHAIRSLAADPARRAEMGAEGRAYVAEHFDRRRLAERYLGLLRNVVGNR